MKKQGIYETANNDSWLFFNQVCEDSRWFHCKGVCSPEWVWSFGWV